MARYPVVCLLFFLLFSQHVQAETDLPGTRLTLNSTILSENREILLFVPRHYNAEQFKTSRYPVLYILDGEKHFLQVVAAVSALSEGLYRYMPETIVVGIVNTDRSRDLTPTHDTILHGGMPIHTSSGGAENFLRFISTELVAFIDSNYRTNGYNMLAGHSFGGLFSTFALLQEQSTFKAFLAHDPSLWWDNGYVLKQMKSRVNQSDFTGKSLYLSIANSDTTEKDRFRHTETIMGFRDFLDSANCGLRFYFEFFEKEDHGTIPLPAYYDGLRMLYSGITLPVKEVPENPAIIEETYRLLSHNLSYQVLPEAPLLEKLANYCALVGSTEAEMNIRKLHVELYPESAYAHFSMAKYYWKKGEHKPGNTYLDRAIELAPDQAANYKKQLKTL